MYTFVYVYEYVQRGGNGLAGLVLALSLSTAATLLASLPSRKIVATRWTDCLTFINYLFDDWAFRRSGAARRLAVTRRVWM